MNYTQPSYTHTAIQIYVNIYVKSTHKECIHRLTYAFYLIFIGVKILTKTSPSNLSTGDTLLFFFTRLLVKLCTSETKFLKLLPSDLVSLSRWSLDLELSLDIFFFSKNKLKQGMACSIWLERSSCRE